MVTILFFKCIAALFNPVYRRGEHIKWGLVSYTAVMFLAVTVLTAIELDVQSISCIDNREFPGFENVFPPGPVGYQEFTNPKAHDVIKNVMFLLNNFLADGFLVRFLFDVSLAIVSNAGSSSSIVATLSTQ